MKSARTGGTQAVIDNAIGYYIDQDPGPMLVVHPGLAEARDWSKDHFDPMVRDTPCLRHKVHSDKIKDRKNELLHKTFLGGILYIIGSNSAAGFRQKTIQRVFLDDVDGYDISAGKEGDQIELARNRTITYTFHQRKIVKVSTPTTRGLSRIEAEFLASDQRHYYVPCPKCGFMQILTFGMGSQFGELSRSYLRFDKENLSWVYYECENCHEKIDERYKLKMIRSGEWRPQAPTRNHAGFHLTEMMSPFSTWEELARGFLATKKMRERLRVFINQRLGETFVEEKTQEVDEDSLLARVENYEGVPARVLTLTMGVDVQLDRLEAVVVGWGLNDECWFIDRRMIIGSPEREQTWNELDEYVARPWRHESGVMLHPWTMNGLSCVTVDSGNSTESVYRYVKRRQSRRFFAVKGDAGNKPIIVNVHYKNRLNARLAILGVDGIKGRLYERLSIQKNADGSYPAGFCHFNRSCNKDFFDQLTSERRVIKKTPAGFPYWAWQLKDGFRNEVFDCYVYNIAALTLLSPNFPKLTERLEEKILALKDTPTGSSPAVATVQPEKRVLRVRRVGKRRGF